MTTGTRISAIWIFGILTILWLCFRTISGQDLMCCGHATGSCRNVCEKVSNKKIVNFDMKVIFDNLCFSKRVR
ncbi:hypothetical protein WA026_001579 [Henosepilachna vigintioctopunctata]|uniref:Uncharacterized protein n=1 Tax=Henosepilachna vigintioctopunctata TaxID=420089 RepID=A0AAW1UIG6_9CUCU